MSEQSKKELYIFDELGNRLVVGFTFEGTFYRRVSKKKHLYKKLNAWGIDKGIFDAEIANCKNIRILDEDSFEVYVSTVENFKKYAIERHNKPHGVQLFLPLNLFTKQKANALQTK